MTFMSDRQKGLLDAFAEVAPKAEIRFCVRHIWANFKLRFSGEAYKMAFWKAARCTTKVEFDAEMAGLKFLDPNEYAYLAAIPPKHWSRHAFSTSCKSNMLLNNMCESFNNVIKEARGQPILTHMEWMRRYTMKRMCDKREGLKGVVGDLMPQVAKYLTFVQDQSRFCSLTPSSNDVYEVDWRGDTYVVDLNTKRCTCFHWQLTGLPCAHGVGCIIDKRGDMKAYIDAAYTKATYALAYAPSIMPLPGVKYWEKVDENVQPLPPAYKKMPGRPSLKKRRKEAGEGTSRQQNTIRVKKSCGKCGQLGHNVKSCKNEAVTSEKNVAVRPLKDSGFSKKRREAVARRKAIKDGLRGNNSAVPNSQATSSSTQVPRPPQAPTSQTPTQPAVTTMRAPTQPASTTTQGTTQRPTTRPTATQGSQDSVTQGVKMAKI